MSIDKKAVKFASIVVAIITIIFLVNSFFPIVGCIFAYIAAVALVFIASYVLYHCINDD